MESVKHLKVKGRKLLAPVDTVKPQYNRLIWAKECPLKSKGCYIIM